MVQASKGFDEAGTDITMALLVVALWSHRPSSLPLNPSNCHPHIFPGRPWDILLVAYKRIPVQRSPHTSALPPLPHREPE